MRHLPVLRPFQVRLTAALAVLLAGLLGGVGAQAQEHPLKWLPAGSTVQTTLSERPARWIRSEMKGGHMGYMARLGELVFRSPLTLGRDAARRGLSCDACHPNGAANVRFFVPGASDRPGNVDVSHRNFHFREDDGRDDPLNIPSLRGVRLTGPYGHDGRIANLRDFSRNVVLREFGGTELESWLLDALVAYQEELALPPRPAIAPDAPGAAAFRSDCTVCHGNLGRLPPPGRYDIGTGGFFEAPVLFGLEETAPYLHDGSAPTIRAAIEAHSDAPPAAELDAIAGYASRLGAVPRRYDPETLEGDVARLKRFLDVLNQPLLDEAAARADRVGDMVTMEIGRVHRRFRPEAKEAQAIVAAWAKSVKHAMALARAHRFPAARDAVAALKRGMDADLPRLAAQRELSLYAARAAN